MGQVIGTPEDDSQIDSNDDSSIIETGLPRTISVLRRLQACPRPAATLARRPLCSTREYVSLVPRDVWDLILGELLSSCPKKRVDLQTAPITASESLRNILAFSEVCTLFFFVVQVSRVWPMLLDESFGQGLSETISYSRISLDSMWDGQGSKIGAEKLQEAKERFHRRAKQEFLKLFFLNRFQHGNVPSVSENGLVGYKISESINNVVYWGAEVISIDEEHTNVFVIVVDVRGDNSKLNDELISFHGFSVIPFDSFRIDQCCNVIARLWALPGQSILLACSKKQVSL